MNWYLAVFHKYFDFSGRASRKEYWYFILFNIAISFALGVVDGALGFGDPRAGLGLLSGIYALIVIVPGLAVAFRRLHDTGRSGWWVLVNFAPLVGSIVFIVFTAMAGDAGTNQYGPAPEGDMSYAAA